MPPSPDLRLPLLRHFWPPNCSLRCCSGSWRPPGSAPPSTAAPSASASPDDSDCSDCRSYLQGSRGIAPPRPSPCCSAVPRLLRRWTPNCSRRCCASSWRPPGAAPPPPAAPAASASSKLPALLKIGTSDGLSLGPGATRQLASAPPVVVKPMHEVRRRVRPCTLMQERGSVYRSRRDAPTSIHARRTACHLRRAEH